MVWTFIYGPLADQHLQEERAFREQLPRNQTAFIGPNGRKTPLNLWSTNIQPKTNFKGQKSLLLPWIRQKLPDKAPNCNFFLQTLELHHHHSSLSPLCFSSHIPLTSEPLSLVF
ncbi:hypothetical protein AMECASPLE_034431 [Ameca splendens]|uniref:Uncharacterized protein n=1 Tax=Ameca splendens TaxID=208324 RepID=A0ABV0XK26_9TELE